VTTPTSHTALTDPRNDYFIITPPPATISAEVTETTADTPSAADAYVAMISELATRHQLSFARKLFDESKHKRGRGGKFAPKPGGGGGKIDYRKKAAKKTRPSEPESERESAPPKIDYRKPAKKTAPPPPAKKVAPAVPPPPPPPTPSPAPVGKKTVGKKTAKKTAPAVSPPPVDDDILDTPAPQDAPQVVEVTNDLLENIATADGVYGGAGGRVIVDGRAGTIRTTDIDTSTGLNRSIGVQFDDAPTELEQVDDPWSAQLIEDADPPYEDILNQPFGPDVLSEPLPEPSTPISTSGGYDDDEELGTPPLSVTPGFETPSPSEMLELQDDMLDDEPWTVGQEDALVDYSGNGYSDMNGCLRFSAGCSDGVETANELAATAMRPLPRAITTFRGANLRALGVANHQALAGMVGNVVRDPGFSSTSLDPSVAVSFGQGSGSADRVIMQIESPAGTPAAYVDGISQNPGEFELVMSPSTRYEILEVVSPTDGGPSTVRLRVVP
jgi:hypothetical protein